MVNSKSHNSTRLLFSRAYSSLNQEFIKEPQDAQL